MIDPIYQKFSGEAAMLMRKWAYHQLKGSTE